MARRYKIFLIVLFALGTVFNGIVCASAQTEDEPELPEDVLVEDPNFPPSEEEYTIENLRKQFEAEPERSDLLVTLMTVLMDAGKYTEALELLEPLDELGDAQWRSQGHLIAGKIVSEKLAPSTGEGRQKLLEQAVKQYSIAIELDQPYPTNLAAYWYLGDLQAELGDTDAAIETLSTYLVLKPLAYEARLRLARIYIDRGNMEKARNLLAEMESDPDEERRAEAARLLASTGGGLSRLGAILVIVAALALIAILALVIRWRGRKQSKGGKASHA